MIINKQSLKYLVKLSRLELAESKEEKILNDLEKILEHFEELKEVNTDDIEPMAGGANLINIARRDGDNFKISADSEKLIGAFPEKEDNLLKVPAVFEEQ